MSAILSSERSGHVRVLTINRPAVHNALTTQLLEEIHQHVAEAESDRATGAVVITGSGNKAFSAGADLEDLSGLDAFTAHARMQRGQRALRGVESAEVPVIAAVNGVALGGGFELVLACTFPVLSTSASLGFPESGLGLMPGYGGTQRLARTIGAPSAAFLMLTGSRMDAQRAHDLGLSPVPPVPPSDLLTEALDIARTISGQGPAAVQRILRALEQGRDAPLDTGLALETALAASTITSEEAAEGIDAFLNKRSPKFRDGGVDDLR